MAAAILKKIEKSPYFGRGLTDFDAIWQSDTVFFTFIMVHSQCHWEYDSGTVCRPYTSAEVVTNIQVSYFSGHSCVLRTYCYCFQ